MKEVDGAVLLDKLTVYDYNEWGKDINSDYKRQYLSDNALSKPFCIIDDCPIFCAVDSYKTRMYFATDTDDPHVFSHVNFYSEIQINRTRNDLLKPRGMYQSLIWKELAFHSGSNFSCRFLQKLLTNSTTSFVDAMLVTDVEQSKLGAAMWVNLLAIMLKLGFKLYFGLSAKSDTRCVIEIDNTDTIRKHYLHDIVKPANNAYAYRTAIILRKGERIEDCIMPGVIVMTNKEAEELNVYREPLFMTETEFYSWKYSLYSEEDDE